jgi:membrane peptidoglycan carboxypeptidase
MYGGPDYVSEPLNNATQAIAQAGSTFKPFALMAAAERGIPLDSIFRGKNGIEVSGYRVNNYGNTSFGRVTLLQATELSINTAYVELASALGIDAVIDTAISAGIPADAAGIDRNLTFVLGTTSPHVLDVANSYATFAAEGVKAEPYLIKTILGSNGGLLYEAVPAVTTAFDTEASRVVNYALERVVTNGTGATARALGRPVAGKTGTTDENKSAWFAGYTPDLSAAVMLMKQDEAGNPISLAGTGGLSSVTGGSFPARIFTAFMRGALEGSPALRFTAPGKLPTVTASPTESLLPTETPTESPLPTETETPTEEPSPTETEIPEEEPLVLNSNRSPLGKRNSEN